MIYDLSMADRKKKRLDFSEVALRIVREATAKADVPLSLETSKNNPLSQTKTTHKIK
jgi:hypothetical protein